MTAYHSINTETPERLMKDLGPFRDAFLMGGLVVVGGYATRLVTGLPVGDDIDVAAAHLFLAGEMPGYVMKEQETCSAVADNQVRARQVWEPKDGGAPKIDVLALKSEPWPGQGLLHATEKFLDSFDCALVQHMVFASGRGRVTFRWTERAETAKKTKVPLWNEGHVTSPERKTKWVRLAKEL